MVTVTVVNKYRYNMGLHIFHYTHLLKSILVCIVCIHSLIDGGLKVNRQGE